MRLGKAINNEKTAHKELPFTRVTSFEPRSESQKVSAARPEQPAAVFCIQPPMQSVEAGLARSSDNFSVDLSLGHSLDVHVQLTPRPAYRLRGCRSRCELHKCLAGSARGTHGVIITPTGFYDAARAGSMRGAARMGSGRVVRAKCMHVNRVECTGVGSASRASMIPSCRI